MSEFRPWPKTPRWNREVTITEKIDGTNGAIIIEKHPYGSGVENPHLLAVVKGDDYNCDCLDCPISLFPHSEYHVYAQSRNRLVRPGTGREAGNDNHGFASWVKERAEDLVLVLGEGRHYGEFCGRGIARGYGLDHKRFALFNATRFSKDYMYNLAPGFVLGLDAVPVLYRGNLAEAPIEDALDLLRESGSRIARGFDRPEGLIIYHSAANQCFKVLIENDEIPKALAA